MSLFTFGNITHNLMENIRIVKHWPFSKTEELDGINNSFVDEDLVFISFDADFTPSISRGPACLARLSKYRTVPSARYCIHKCTTSSKTLAGGRMMGFMRPHMFANIPC